MFLGFTPDQKSNDEARAWEASSLSPWGGRRRAGRREGQENEGWKKVCDAMEGDEEKACVYRIGE